MNTSTVIILLAADGAAVAVGVSAAWWAATRDGLRAANDHADEMQKQRDEAVAGLRGQWAVSTEQLIANAEAREAAAAKAARLAARPGVYVITYPQLAWAVTGLVAELLRALVVHAWRQARHQAESGPAPRHAAVEQPPTEQPAAIVAAAPVPVVPAQRRPADNLPAAPVATRWECDVAGEPAPFAQSLVNRPGWDRPSALNWLLVDQKAGASGA